MDTLDTFYHVFRDEFLPKKMTERAYFEHGLFPAFYHFEHGGRALPLQANHRTVHFLRLLDSCMQFDGKQNSGTNLVVELYFFRTTMIYIRLSPKTMNKHEQTRKPF